MKTTQILAALLALAIATPAAFAKKPKGGTSAGGVFARYDKNGNGVLDADEKEAINAALATDPELKAFDTNGDGKLDDAEIAAIKPEAGKKKKKKK